MLSCLVVHYSTSQPAVKPTEDQFLTAVHCPFTVQFGLLHCAKIHDASVQYYCSCQSLSGIVCSLASIAEDLVGATNLFLWSSTICSRYCFCSSSRVKLELNSWINANPRSARSLTTLTDWTSCWLHWYSAWHSYSLGSICRKSWDIPRIVKKSIVFLVTKLWSFFVFGFWNGWIRFRGLSEPSTSWSATTIKRFSSVVASSSKKAKAMRISERYQRWRSNAEVAALAISVFGYSDNAQSSARSCRGAQCAAGLSNQYVRYTLVTNRLISCRWCHICWL